MTDRRDDDFRVRPSAPKNRGKGQGQSFVSKVLKQAGKASSGKSAVHRPIAGGSGQRAGQRPGSRLGRGHTAARFAGAKLTPMSRRVTIKTLLVNQRNASPQSLAKHLRYIERDGAGRDGEPGRAYGPQADEADLDAFKERCQDDRHHFRFIVSPEDGAELDDLRTYIRHLMNRMEADLGTRLDWVVVDHWNTDNPHTHLIVRGRDDTGKDLIIAGDYIAHGFRHRAAELATEWLGPRTELEIQQTLQREVEQERWTSLDRALQREAGEDGRVQIERFNEPTLQRQRLLLIGRLQRLQRLGLADETQPGTWAVHADAEKTLRALGERGDIIRTMQRAMSGQPRELAVFEPGDDGRAIVGRVAGKGLADELHDRGYLVIDGVDGKAHYVALNARDELANYPTGAVVEVRGSAEVRAADKNIAALASNGLYRADHHPCHRTRPGHGWTRSAGSRRGARSPAGSPAPGWHRGARGRWTMEGAGRPGRAWPPVRRTTPGRRGGGAEIASTHRTAGARDRGHLARPATDRRRPRAGRPGLWWRCQGSLAAARRLPRRTGAGPAARAARDPRPQSAGDAAQPGTGAGRQGHCRRHRPGASARHGRAARGRHLPALGHARQRALRDAR